MPDDGPAFEPRPAVVVFSHAAAFWWMRFFKPGFRHCFVCVACEWGWIVIDPLSHRTETRAAGPMAPAALAAWFERRGCRAVVTALRPAPETPAPAGPCTCVETVKRILGLRARGVFTPWRLYQAVTGGKNAAAAFMQ